MFPFLDKDIETEVTLSDCTLDTLVMRTEAGREPGLQPGATGNCLVPLCSFPHFPQSMYEVTSRTVLYFLMPIGVPAQEVSDGLLGSFGECLYERRNATLQNLKHT